MPETPASALLRLPVRLHGIDIGRPVDVLLSGDRSQAVGLEVVCGDGARRFLPLRAASVAADEISIASAFALLDEDQLRFYRTRGSVLSELRGELVEDGGAPVGPLEDVLLDAELAVVGLEVSVEGERRRVPAAA